MRILAIGPQNVFPPIDGGKEGIFGAISALSQYSEIVYVYPGKCNQESLNGYSSVRVTAKPINYEPRETLWLLIKSIFLRRSYKFEKYSNIIFARAIAKEIREEHFDAIICFHSHTFRLAELLLTLTGWCIPIVLREHNIEYLLVRSYRESLRFPLKIVAGLFEKYTRNDEYRAWSKASFVAFLTDADLLTAQNSGVRGEFRLVPEGIPLPVISNALNAEQKLIMLLNPRAVQSVNSIKLFIREYWIPAKKAGNLQGIRLAITGVDPKKLEKVCGILVLEQIEAQIESLGFLDEISFALRSSLALVSPTFIGGGIRKKILESMAHSVPVLATPIDVQSCGYFKTGINILEFDSLASFVKHVQELSLDTSYREKLGKAGRMTVEREASWDLFADKIIQELSHIISNERV